MTDKNKVFSMIGLATRARKVVSGEFSTEKSVKSGRSHMVIVSEEASDNTKKMFTNMCTHYKVPIYLFGTKEELGHAMGQEFRASLSVEDAGFAKTLASRMNVNGGSLNESTLSQKKVMCGSPIKMVTIRMDMERSIMTRQQHVMNIR